MQRSIQAQTRPSPITIRELVRDKLSDAAAQAAQSKLLLRRACADVQDSDQLLALHDLAGILQHVIAEIDAIARRIA